MINHLILFHCRSVHLHNGEIFIRYAGDEFLLFSNNKNRLRTNSLYSVGMSEINSNVSLAINDADSNMLKSKRGSK